MLAAVLAISCTGVEAQTTPVEPLSLPGNGLLLCHAIPDPEGTMLEFTDSGNSFSRRETTLGFDTAGNPLMMAVTAEAKSAEGKPAVHIVVVRFQPIAEGAVTVAYGFDPNFEMPLRRDEDSADSLPRGWKKATADEVRQARALALDFWKRRCGKHLKPPAPNRPPVTE